MDKGKDDFQAHLLRWEDVAAAASEAFDVWTHKRELAWAKLAWERLSASNLVAYSNEIERHEAAILFLALVGLYRDFCAIAWEERANPTYSSWTDCLELNHFVIGQLVGRDPNTDGEEALDHLVARVRPKLVCALQQVFGSQNALFVSLWRTNEWIPPDDDPEGSEREPTDDEILNDWTPDKQAAYEWLEQGAEVVLDPA